MKKIFSNVKLRMFLIALQFVSVNFSVFSQELTEIAGRYYWQHTIYDEVFTNYNETQSNKFTLALRLDYNSQTDWDIFSETSALMGFFNTYGPEGSDILQLKVTFTHGQCTNSCPGGGGLTADYCYCLFHGFGNNTIGNWSERIPAGTIINSYNPSFGSIDSSIIWGEYIGIGYNFTNFYAQFPDQRGYSLPNPPELQSMQNLLDLRDTLNGNNNATVLYALIDTTDHCPVDDTRSGTFWLSNNGHDTITSAKIGIGWNGVIQDSILWTGTIPPYEHRTIHDFAGKIVHLDSLAGTVDIVVMEVNGQPDEEPGNNLWQSASNKATSINQNDLVFEWNTSNFTQDNYFKLTSEDGTKIWQLGDSLVEFGYSQIFDDTFNTGATYLFPIDITGFEHQCLKFSAFHELGGFFGQSIRLLAGEQEIFNYSGWSTSFGGRKFYHGMPESTPTTDIVKPGLSIKPNPANQTVVLQANQLQAGEVTWAAYNTLGQQVWAQSGQANGSNAEIAFDVSNWPSGLYFVSVRNAKSVVTNRLMVQH